MRNVAVFNVPPRVYRPKKPWQKNKYVQKAYNLVLCYIDNHINIERER